MKTSELINIIDRCAEEAGHAKVNSMEEVFREVSFQLSRYEMLTKLHEANRRILTTEFGEAWYNAHVNECCLTVLAEDLRGTIGEFKHDKSNVVKVMFDAGMSDLQHKKAVEKALRRFKCCMADGAKTAEDAMNKFKDAMEGAYNRETQKPEQAPGKQPETHTSESKSDTQKAGQNDETKPAESKPETSDGEKVAGFRGGKVPTKKREIFVIQFGKSI